MLGALRDDSGKPTTAVRALALLVALLLGFPVTLWVIGVVRSAADLAW